MDDAKIEVSESEPHSDCRRQMTTVKLELVRNVWAGATDCQVMTLKVEADTVRVIEIVQRQRID